MISVSILCALHIVYFIYTLSGRTNIEIREDLRIFKIAAQIYGIASFIGFPRECLEILILNIGFGQYYGCCHFIQIQKDIVTASE